MRRKEGGSMALKIEFEKYGDQTVYNPQRPTFVLMTRSGKKIGILPANDEDVKSCMNSSDEVSFTVHKPIESPIGAKMFSSQPTPPYSVGDTYTEGAESSAVAGVAVAGKAVVGHRHKTYICVKSRASGEFNQDDWIEKPLVSNKVWDNLTNFKLLWCREWNLLFELYVEVEEGTGLVKYVTGTSLGEAELGQINLYDIHINTESDIERDDYEPTTLYNPDNPNASLLNRILEKAPHYTIGHVDSSIADIQRTFEFNSKSVYDSLQEVAKEIECIFKIDCRLDSDMNIVREINAYDLLSTCLDCGARGNFTTFCEECFSQNIIEGYGNDTTIFVSIDNLTDEIRYSTDTGAVKNCFKLEAGDDMMTASVRLVNPNGSDYIWHITDDMKADMSDELVAKINEYDELYSYYQDEYTYPVQGLSTSYNSIARKYNVFSPGHATINPYLVGYSDLSEAYYNSVDLYYLVSDELMPTPKMIDTTASEEAEKLTAENMSPVALPSLSVASSSTVENAVLAMAKVIVDSRYKVEIVTTSFSSNVWTGHFIVTNYSDDTDTDTSSDISIVIDDDYETYVKQKIDKSINKRMTEEEEANDIISLFKLDLSNFSKELQKYSLSMLLQFRDSCQTCIDVLIEQGISDADSWASEENNLYNNLYRPYFEKLRSIDNEISTKTSELQIISNMQNKLVDGMLYVNEQLNFEDFLGDDLWLEFASYRREDVYQNSNYITDGLNNAEIIDMAREFVAEANKELYKSATLQHSITSTLQNLLVIKEFQPIVDNFETGNWIRIRVDDNIYKLRLIEYEIEYNNLETISVTFSDVLQVSSGISDIESILNQAKSMATSYGATTRQAKQGDENAKKVDGWVNDGLALTTMKIVNVADDQNITFDEHGMLAREYDDILSDYSDKQLKIINQGLYVTDDGWKTSRAGIGAFTFLNPETNQVEDAYGVIADTIVGRIILGENVGIYTSDATTKIDENGIYVTNGVNTISINPNSAHLVDIIKTPSPDEDHDSNINHLMYIDDDGNLNLSGIITSSSINCNDTFVVDTAGNVIANSLTSNNATITGGSIHVSTNSEYVDVINFNYIYGSTSRSSMLSPYSLTVNEDSDYGSFVASLTSRGLRLIDPTGAVGGKTYVELAQGVGGGGVLNLFESDGYETISVNGKTGMISLFDTSTGTSKVAIKALNGNITCVSLTQTSDENAKNNIVELDKQISAHFIYSLNPVSFRYNDVQDGSHHGVTTQDVKRQIHSIYGDSDWAVVNEPNGDSFENDQQIYQSLAYTELIADLIATVQSQNERIAELEAKI